MMCFPCAVCVVTGSLFVLAWAFVEIFCAKTKFISTTRLYCAIGSIRFQLDMIIVLCVSYFLEIIFIFLRGCFFLLILHKCVIAFCLYIIVTSLKLIKAHGTSMNDAFRSSMLTSVDCTFVVDTEYWIWYIYGLHILCQHKESCDVNIKCTDLCF